MSPQCLFIQMSFWDGTGAIFNDSEQPSQGTQRLRFADCGSSLCELHGWLCVRKILLGLLLWEPAHVSFPISEMGITTSLTGPVL